MSSYKYFTLALASLACLGLGLTRPAFAQAPLSTIGAARAAGPAYGVTGNAITVTGVVTNGAELGTIRYFQEATGGMAVFGASTSPFLTALNNLQRGDSVIVSGTLVNYRGLLEINPITALTVVATQKRLPRPVVFTLAMLNSAFAEQYEGRLVRLNGQTGIQTATGGPVTTFAGSTAYQLSGNSTAVAYVNSSSNLVGQPAPTGAFDLIGIMSQFASTAAVASAGGGYQVLPRLAADLVPAGGLATQPAAGQGAALVVAPNPAHGSFQLLLPGSATGPATLVLRDALGRVALTQTTQPLPEGKLRVDVSSLRPGLYLVQLVLPTATHLGRVVVE